MLRRLVRRAGRDARLSAGHVRQKAQPSARPAMPVRYAPATSVGSPSGNRWPRGAANVGLPDDPLPSPRSRNAAFADRSWKW